MGRVISVYTYILVSALGALFGIAYFIGRTGEKETTNLLTVGMMSGWDPFMSLTATGDVEGFDVDVAKEVAKRLDKKLIIQDLGSLDSLFIALEQEKIDAVFSGLDITQKRRSRFSMVPYTGEMVSTFYLVFWEKVPEGISTIIDLKKLSNPLICVEPGVSTEQLLDRFDFIEKKSISSLATMILDIRTGRSTAAFLEPQIVKRLVSKNMPLKTVPVPLPEEFQVFGLGIALKKDNPLTDAITQVITAMRQDGTLAALEQKWNVGA